MRLLECTVFDRPPHCERCGLLATECRCPPAEPARTPPGKQTLKLALEKRGKGKLATIVRGLAPDHDAKALLARLQSACGAGGSLDADALLLQGDQRERLRAALSQLGFKVKG